MNTNNCTKEMKSPWWSFFTMNKNEIRIGVNSCFDLTGEKTMGELNKIKREYRRVGK